PHRSLSPYTTLFRSNERSYVFAQQRGLLDRVQDFLSGSPADQREVYVLAERKIAEAAADSDLRARADANTRAMLEGMLKSLGFKIGRAHVWNSSHVK